MNKRIFFLIFIAVLFFVLAPRESQAITCCICRNPLNQRVVSCPELPTGETCRIYEQYPQYLQCGNPVKNCEIKPECRIWYQTGRGSPEGIPGTAPGETIGPEAEEKERPFVPPKLQIPIPGLTLTTEESKIKICTECADPEVVDPADCPKEKCRNWAYQVPWIGEYLLAFYKWAVGALAILAVVMIMVRGFQWILAGGAPEKISEAKKGIGSALLGLVLILLVHQIFSFIDPRLTIFKPITIGVIKRIEVDYEPPPAVPAEFVEEELWKFSSQAIRNQIPDASNALANFMNCVGGKIKEKTRGKKGVITSISDSAGMSNCLPTTYKRPPCAHTKNSCHYGGPNCQGKSYALDIWSKGEVSPDIIIETIKECQTNAFICYTPKTPNCSGHYNHIHTSVGKINGCGCN